MPKEDDWSNEYKDEEITTLDRREAVPLPVSSKDTTGKYKTLPGFANAIKHTDEEVAVIFAQGRIYESKKIFTALRLLRIGAGDHPDTAVAFVEGIKKWMVDNERLIDEVMKDDD